MTVHLKSMCSREKTCNGAFTPGVPDGIGDVWRARVDRARERERALLQGLGSQMGMWVLRGEDGKGQDSQDKHHQFYNLVWGGWVDLIIQGFS